MEKSYDQLMTEVKESAKDHFASADGMDTFFLNLIDNFTYRYLEDDKHGSGQFLKVDRRQYLGFSLTYSLKLIMTLIPQEDQPRLKAKVKETIKSSRPTIKLSLLIDASKLENNGAGIIKVTGQLNWDFPEHIDQLKSVIKTWQFTSSNIDTLRKDFPLYLDELCQFFC